MKRWIPLILFLSGLLVGGGFTYSFFPREKIIAKEVVKTVIQIKKEYVEPKEFIPVDYGYNRYPEAITDEEADRLADKIWQFAWDFWHEKYSHWIGKPTMPAPYIQAMAIEMARGKMDPLVTVHNYTLLWFSPETNPRIETIIQEFLKEREQSAE